MEENKNKIPKDKDGDDHADHQKDGNEEPGLKNDEKKSCDQPTQGVDEGTSGTGGGNPTVENRDLGSRRMTLLTDQLENLQVTYKGRFKITQLPRNEMNLGVGSSVGGSGSVDHIGNYRVTRKGRFTITEFVKNQGVGSSVGESGGGDHTGNIGSSVSGEGSQGNVVGLPAQKGGFSDQCRVPRSGDGPKANMDVESGNQGSGSVGVAGGEGDPNVLDQGIVFGPVTQKGGFSDQCRVPTPSVSQMPRSGEQDNMEIASKANKDVASGSQGSGSVGPVGSEGDQNVLGQGIVFGPVTQKGGFSDQCSVPTPSVNPMPRSGDQDNMTRRSNAKRNVRSGDDGGIGEASHGDESEDDMELDHDEGSTPRDAKRAKK